VANAPLAAFWRGWLRTFRPAGVIGVTLAALAIVVALDRVWLAGTAYGALWRRSCSRCSPSRSPPA
jgi:hypothetical protein